ncbi:MAG: twin-arginine translocase TatA/TatE family subunit [Marmoricola sp.]
MTHGLLIPLVLGLGVPELAIIVGIIVLLFGAKKLPELARGSGRALRIFKAETKGLLDDEDDDEKTPEQRQIDAQNRKSAEAEKATRPAPEDPGSPGTL